MDVTQALKDSENALRDFIASTLESKFGPDWHERSGVTNERIHQWRDRQQTEKARQTLSGTVDQRLIYYADFYDLRTILKKHWDLFTPAFGEFRQLDVWLSELEKLRDPDAHRRAMLPHQQHLALGIAGEIRTRLVRYRSKMETSEDYYPRIEFVSDNYGNTAAPPRLTVNTGMKLRVGDVLEYVVTASDPQGEELQYRLSGMPPYDESGWKTEHVLSFTLTAKQVGVRFEVGVEIRSLRQFHARNGYDDNAIFTYEVLPPRVAG